MDRSLRIQVILAAVDRAVRPMRAIAAASKEAKDKLAATRAEFRTLQRAEADLASFRKLREQMRGDGNAIDEARRKARALAAELKASENPTARLRREYERSRQEVRQLVAQQRQHIESARTLRDRLAQAGVGVTRLGRDEAQLRDRMAATTAEMDRQRAALERLAARDRRIQTARASSGRLQATSSNMVSAGATGMVAAAALEAPVLLASKAAMSFEDAMADVKKVVNFDTPKQFDQLTSEIQALSLRLPVSAAELAQITAEAARSGVALHELTKFTEDAAMMKVAFDIDANAASEMMAAWRNAFGLNQKGVETLADQINALTNKWGGHADQVAEMVTRVGPLGKVGGVAAGAMAAMAQTLNSMGVESEVGATGIKNLILRLNQGAAATKQQRSAFKALGLDAKQVAEGMQRDAEGTITAVLGKIAKLPKAQQTSVLTQLFGSESVGAIAPLLTQLDKLKGAFGLVKDETMFAGAVQKEFESRASTTSNELSTLKNTANAVGVVFGSFLLPVIKAVSATIRGVGKDVLAWAQAHPRLAQALGITLAVLGAIVGVVSALTIAIGAILAPIAALNIMLVVLDLTLGPILLIVLAVIAAIALLAGAAWLVVKYWKPISAFFGAIWQGFLKLISPVTDAVKALLQDLQPFFAWLSGVWALVMQSAAAFGEWAARVGLLQKVFAVLKVAALLVFSPLIAGVAVAIGALWLFIQGWRLVIAVIKVVFAAIGQFFSGGLAAIAARILKFSPAGLFMMAFAALWPWLSSLGSKFLAIGGQLVDGMINGIRAKVAALIDTVKKAGGAAWQAMKERLGIHSPSRVFAQLGAYTMAGMADGIRRGQAQPIEQLQKMAGRMAAAGAVTLAPPAALAVPVAAAAATPPPPIAAPIAANQVARPSEVERPAQPAALLAPPALKVLPPAAAQASVTIVRERPALQTVAPQVLQVAAQAPLARPADGEQPRPLEVKPLAPLRAPADDADRRGPRRPPAAAPAGGDRYELHFHIASGDPKEIERAVRKALQAAEREKDARRRTSFNDYDD